MRRALILFTTVVALAGCGEKTPMSDAEVATVTRWAEAYKPVAADMVAASEAIRAGRLDAAQAALDRTSPKVAAAEAQVRALKTADLKRTLDDYMRITRRTLKAFDGFVTHLRTDPKNSRERLQAQQELRDANDELFTADSQIRDRIFDHANGEQQKRLDPVIPLPGSG